MTRYFTLPMYGTPYTKFCIVEHGVVTAIDISRPDGKEIPYPINVKYKLKPIRYADKSSDSKMVAFVGEEDVETSYPSV